MGKGFAKQKKQMKMLQEKMSQYQKQMDETESSGSAGNGLVSITLNGNHEMKKISINPECVDPEDVEGLEDLIQEAYKQAAKGLENSMPSMPGMPSGGLPF